MSAWLVVVVCPGVGRRSTYRWRVTVEGTRAAISNPSGRMVRRAAEAVSNGPPCPNRLEIILLLTS